MWTLCAVLDELTYYALTTPEGHPSNQNNLGGYQGCQDYRCYTKLRCSCTGTRFKLHKFLPKIIIILVTKLYYSKI